MPTVYIAEDSPTMAHVIRSLIDGAPDLTVVGVGADGLLAKEGIEQLRPDILVTDLIMPKMDGYELIQWVMATRPIPIVVLSTSIDRGDTELVMRCLQLGAMEARSKPRINTPEEFAAIRESFQGLLRALAKVKPITRFSSPKPLLPYLPFEPTKMKDVDLLLIGASTGGPQVVLDILKKLGPGFPLPALLALHMQAGFMDGMGRWLEEATGWKVSQKANGEPLVPGTLHLPPEGRHLVLSAEGRAQCIRPDSEDRMVPSVDRLFLSAAHLGNRVAALLLTGMGRDGALGLLAIRKAGGLTLTQDEASCVVYGMPGAAVELGASTSSLSPDAMVDLLRSLTLNKRNLS